MTTKKMITRHIRHGVVPSGRRINDRRGSPGVTFCGEPIGSLDCVADDLKGNCDGKGWKKVRWYRDHDGCEECLSQAKRLGAL